MSVPFIDIVDPGFELNGPEVVAAQASSWYAETRSGCSSCVTPRHTP